MARGDWFRNTQWDDAIEAAFDKRLYRSRNPRQYLRIQAFTLLSTRPEISLYLLEEYFAYPLDYDAIAAYHTQAEAFLALRKFKKAADALKKGIEFARKYDAVDMAHFDFPVLVAVRRMKSHYAFARDVLAKIEASAAMPVQFFQWFAASALLEEAAGRRSEAARLAGLAVEAARIQRSGFVRHPSVGLVPSSYQSLANRMVRLSKLDSIS